MYIPDNWIILKIEDGDDSCYYKVLAGWSGGYLDGDSWKMNSGITEIEQDETYYSFIGESGSIYYCNKHSETVRMNISGVLNQLLERFPDKVSVVPVSDILELFGVKL
jgi:hypothetical protein